MAEQALVERIEGHSRKMASASPGVSVRTLPEPNVTPPLEAVPGCTSNMFAPMLAIVCCTADEEP